MVGKAKYLVLMNLYIKKYIYIYHIGIQCYFESEKYPENDAFSVIQNVPCFALQYVPCSMSSE